MIHVPDFEAATVETLRASFPIFLASVAAEVGYELPPPDDDGGSIDEQGVSYSYGDQEVLRWPYVEVAVPDATITNLSIGQYAGDFAMNVIVRCLVSDPVGPRLNRKIKFYGRALLETLLQPDAFGDGEVVGSVRIAYRTNPETNEREEFVGGVLLVFEIPSVVVRP